MISFLVGVKPKKRDRRRVNKRVIFGNCPRCGARYKFTSNVVTEIDVRDRECNKCGTRLKEKEQK